MCISYKDLWSSFYNSRSYTSTTRAEKFHLILIDDWRDRCTCKILDFVAANNMNSQKLICKVNLVK